MIRKLLRMLSLVLALCVVCAFALAEEDVAEMETEIAERLPGSPDGLLVLKDSLYAFLWNDCYRLTEDGWERHYLVQDGSPVGFDAAGDALYCLTRKDGAWDPETGEYLQAEGGFYHVMSAEVAEDGSIGDMTELCTVSWTVNEQDWPQIYGFRVQDGAAYILLFDWSGENSDWENNALWKIDLTTGQGTLVTTNYLSGLARYKDGLLLSRYYNRQEAWQEDGTVLPPELATVDPATGEVTILGKMTDYSAGAIAYDEATDSIYYSDTSFVYRMNAAGASEAVGYLLASTSSRDYSASVVYDERYYVSDWSSSDNLSVATVDPSLLPTRTLRLAQNWMVEEQIRDFAKAHPDVAIEYVTNTPYTAEETTRHMESSDAADVYTMYLSSGYYKILRDKGWLVDLSSSEKLMETVGRMYPHLTKEQLVNGKLYALPVYLRCNMSGYYPDGLEKVGLTEEDLPRTYDELMDFLVTWRDDYLYDFEDVRIYEYTWDLRQELFTSIFTAQMLACEARGEMMTFNTPTLRALLNRLDSNEMKAVLKEIVPPVDNANELVYISSSDRMANAIFADYYDPMPSIYRHYGNTKAMFLQLDEDTPPVIQAEEYMMVVNPRTQNMDLVMELLEYIADHLPVDFRTAIMPDVNDPIEVSYYQENLEDLDKSIADMEKRLAELKPEDEGHVAEMQETLEWYRQYRKDLEEERWATSEEDIAFYREHIAPYLVVMSNATFSGDTNQAETILQRYMDGQMSADQFINEFDRIVTMMQMENQ